MWKWELMENGHEKMLCIFRGLGLHRYMYSSKPIQWYTSDLCISLLKSFPLKEKEL